MRLTIIPADMAVYVDGVCKMPLDLTSCGLPLDVHALQWYETKGWIEFNDDEDPFTPKPDNLVIEALPDWAMACVDVWDSWVPPPPPEPPQPPIEETTPTA